jgi:acid phosphatase
MLSTAGALLLLASPALALPSPEPAALPIEAVSTVGRVGIPHRPQVLINSAEDFDVLHHLAGDSPYFNSPGVGLKDDVPAGCAITHATYLVRHSDIYANDVRPSSSHI